MTQTATQKRTRRSEGGNREIATQLIGEAVEMLGFPQIIVTRDFVYQFLRGCGWCPCERGFGSIDYMAFGRKAVAGPPTDDATRDRLMTQVRNGYVRTPCDKPNANCSTRAH